jgi:hypothetical protein
VGGDFNVTSSDADPYLNLCRYISEYFNYDVVKGNLSCVAPAEKINPNLSSPTPTPTPSSHKGKLDKPAIIGTSFGVVILALCISSILACWMIKKLRWQPRREGGAQTVPT